MTSAKDADHDRAALVKDFNDAVNMTPASLERWLEGDDSKSVGMTRKGDTESVGHEAGRRIVAIKRKKAADLDDDDLQHMRKVVGYIHRHLAQGGPDKDADHSRWRYSLMNWGHDPTK